MPAAGLFFAGFVMAEHEAADDDMAVLELEDIVRFAMMKRYPAAAQLECGGSKQEMFGRTRTRVFQFFRIPDNFLIIWPGSTIARNDNEDTGSFDKIAIARCFHQLFAHLRIFDDMKMPGLRILDAR